MAKASNISISYSSSGKKYTLDKTKKYVAEKKEETKKEEETKEEEEKKEEVLEDYGKKSEMTKKGDLVDTVDGDYKIVIGKTEKIGKEEPLPAWQKEWDNYPKVEFPADTRALRAKGKVNDMTYDTIQKVNEYELERMIRTIYKYAMDNPDLWENGDSSTNISKLTIKIEMEEDMAFHTFYPWRNDQIENMVTSMGSNADLRIYAVDVYNKGKFMETQYFMK